MSWFLKKPGKVDSNWLYVCYLPFFACIFDYAENFSIISLLINYPEVQEKCVFISNTFSVLKSLSTIITLSVLLIIVLIWVFKRYFENLRK